MLPSVGKVGPLNGQGDGLTPPLSSSVEPIGIVPTPSGALVPGDEGVDCIMPALPALDTSSHAPEAEVVPPIPICDVPMEVPTPPPSKSPVALLEPAPTTAEQIVNPDPNVLGGAGLNPGVASSVAPRGMPAGPTEPLAAALMPNGEVCPIPGVGLPIPPTWAKTGLPPRSVARVTAMISSRRTVASITDNRILGFRRPGL